MATRAAESEMKLENLSGSQKAAVLIITLGPERSADLFQYFSDEEIEAITLQIANMRKVSPELKQSVLEDFYNMALAKDFVSKGGLEYAREILANALGEAKANMLINRLSSIIEVVPFDFLRKTDPAQLLNFIQNEHPQTIALVVAYMDSIQAGQVLGGLPQELQVDVSRRLAQMERTSPEVIHEVEKVLEKKLAAVMSHDYAKAGGVKSLVEILNRVDRSTEKQILERLEEEDPELADEVRKLMFVFEDIVLLGDRDIQRVVKETDKNDLSLSLKGSTAEVQEIVFRNMSKRAAADLKDDMDFMGPVRVKDVEEAQSRIVGVIRRLEDAGEIVVSRGGTDEIIG